MGQPDDQGACKSDHFEVLNAGNEAPIICGDNDGQHSTFFFGRKILLNHYLIII